MDLLNDGERFSLKDGRLVVEQVALRWGRVLQLEVS
jgi:hypothetical protein